MGTLSVADEAEAFVAKHAEQGGAAGRAAGRAARSLGHAVAVAASVRRWSRARWRGTVLRQPNNESAGEVYVVYYSKDPIRTSSTD